MEEHVSAMQQYVVEIENIKLTLDKKEEENDSSKQSALTWQKTAEEGQRLLQEKLEFIEKMQKEYSLNAEALNKEIQRLQEIIETITNQHKIEKEDIIIKHENLLKEQFAEKENKLQEITSQLEQKTIETNKLMSDLNLLQEKQKNSDSEIEKLTSNSNGGFENLNTIQRNTFFNIIFFFIK